MAADRRIRHYLAVQPQGELAEHYSAWHRERSRAHRQTIHQQVGHQLQQGLRQLGLHQHVTPHVMAHPSLGWRLVLEGQPDIHGPDAAEQVWSIIFDMRGSRQAALDHLQTIRSALPTQLPHCSHVTTSADLPVFTADYWSPAEATAPLFGDREGARTLLGANTLRHHKLSGNGVNVIVVDEGVDKALVRRLGGTYGGGWEYRRDSEQPPPIVPGDTKGGHGAMMVRNILDIAPHATIFDCPMLPPRILNIRHFLSHADAAYARMLADIRHLRTLDDRWRGPWIFVNAWAIYDRRYEHPIGDYTDNPHHRFNRLVARAVEEDHDVIFCAGNCGQFCPAGRCGETDRGPGHSIFGANSHPSVLTVGAVRVDGLWLGYSSQGPGQPQLARDKPDLCAPSQFADIQDAAADNTGSSAASALAAGVVAALRSRWDAKALPPQELKKLLAATARKTEGRVWNGRLGHGILDAAKAYQKAERRLKAAPAAPS